LHTISRAESVDVRFNPLLWPSMYASAGLNPVLAIIYLLKKGE